MSNRRRSVRTIAILDRGRDEGGATTSTTVEPHSPLHTPSSLLRSRQQHDEQRDEGPGIESPEVVDDAGAQPALLQRQSSSKGSFGSGKDIRRLRARSTSQVSLKASELAKEAIEKKKESQKNIKVVAPAMTTMASSTVAGEFLRRVESSKELRAQQEQQQQQQQQGIDNEHEHEGVAAVLSTSLEVRDLVGEDDITMQFTPRSPRAALLRNTNTTLVQQQEVVGVGGLDGSAKDEKEKEGGSSLGGVATHRDVFSKLELDSVKDVFYMFDTDRSGAIDKEELGSVMRYLGLELSESELTELLSQVDIDHSGSIDLEEFTDMLRMYKEAAQFKLFGGSSMSKREKRGSGSGASGSGGGRSGGGGGWGDSFDDASSLISIFTDRNRNIPSDWTPIILWQIFMLIVATGYWIVVLFSDTMSNEDAKAFMIHIVPFEVLGCIAIILDMFVSLRINDKSDSVSFVNMKFIRRWMWLDLLTLLPWNLMLAATDMYVARVLFHLKLLRLVKAFVAYFDPSGRIEATRVYVVLNFYAMYLIRAFVTFVVVVHTSALIFFLLRERNATEDTYLDMDGNTSNSSNNAFFSSMVSKTGSLDSSDSTSALSSGGGGGVNGSSIVVGASIPHLNFVTCLYVATYAVTAVGYGNVPTATWDERVFCAALCFVAQAMSAYVVGRIAQAVMQADVGSRKLHEVSHTLDVVKLSKVPMALINDAIGFREHSIEENQSESYKDLISNLPTELQKNITLFVKLRLVSNSRMFRLYHRSTQVAIAQEMDALVFRPEEVILWAGDHTTNMFFLSYGFVNLQDKRGRVIATLSAGAQFSEDGVLITGGCPSLYTARSHAYSEIFILTGFSFLSVTRRFPLFKSWMAEAAKHRVKQRQNGELIFVLPKSMRSVEAMKAETQRKRRLKKQQDEEEKKKARGEHDEEEGQEDGNGQKDEEHTAVVVMDVNISDLEVPDDDNRVKHAADENTLQEDVRKEDEEEPVDEMEENVSDLFCEGNGYDEVMLSLDTAQEARVQPSSLSGSMMMKSPLRVSTSFPDGSTPERSNSNTIIVGGTPSVSGNRSSSVVTSDELKKNKKEGNAVVVKDLKLQDLEDANEAGDDDDDGELEDFGIKVAKVKGAGSPAGGGGSNLPRSNNNANVIGATQKQEQLFTAEDEEEERIAELLQDAIHTMEAHTTHAADATSGGGTDEGEYLDKCVTELLEIEGMLSKMEQVRGISHHHSHRRASDANFLKRISSGDTTTTVNSTGGGGGGILLSPMSTDERDDEAGGGGGAEDEVDRRLGGFVAFGSTAGGGGQHQQQQQHQSSLMVFNGDASLTPKNISGATLSGTDSYMTTPTALAGGGRPPLPASSSQQRVTSGSTAAVSSGSGSGTGGLQDSPASLLLPHMSPQKVPGGDGIINAHNNPPQPLPLSPGSANRSVEAPTQQTHSTSTATASSTAPNNDDVTARTAPPSAASSSSVNREQQQQQHDEVSDEDDADPTANDGDEPCSSGYPSSESMRHDERLLEAQASSQRRRANPLLPPAGNKEDEEDDDDTVAKKKEAAFEANRKRSGEVPMK